MHEAALARQLLTVVLERARAERASRIVAVRAWVSECEPLSAESLAAHFAAHGGETIARGARLELRVTTVRAQCGGCGGAYVPAHHVLLCPRCGSADGTLLGPTGMGVDTLEVELEGES